MQFRIIALLRRLQKDEDGVSIIEMGLFAPIVGLMVMGIIDISMGFSTRLQLEQAAFRTLELAHLSGNKSTFDHLKKEAAAAAGVTESEVTVRNWLECDGEEQDYTMPCGEEQSMARYVEIRIESSYKPSFGYGPVARSFTNVNPDGSIPLTASSSVRIQ